jgi:heptosyltransferase-2
MKIQPRMDAEKGMLLGLPERWDEACFAVPAVRALEMSGLARGLVLREEQAEFWRTVSGLPQLVFSEKTGAGKLAGELCGEWEVSLVWGNGIAAQAFAKAKIAKRLGPEKAMPAKLLTHPLDVSEGATEHRVRLYLKTCERMGVAVDKPEFFEPAHLGIPVEPGTVLLCPGSDFGASYEWPLDRWQELGESLRKEGRRVKVAGGGGGRGLAKMLADRLGGGTEFFHAEPLAAALPLLAVHELTVAADGSLPHLAAHAGSRCITLFGPNDAVWKRPLGKRHKVVKRHVECAPCLSAKCLLDGRCQTELEVARVLAAIVD